MNSVHLPAMLRGDGEPKHVTLDVAEAVCASLAGTDVTLDCETSGYALGHPLYALRTIQLGNEHVALDFDADDEQHVALAVRTLDSAARVIAHSATADISLLAVHAGIDASRWWAKAVDTMVLAALASEAEVGDRLGLEALTSKLIEKPYKATTAHARKRLFTENKWLTETSADTPFERSGWAQISKTEPIMVKYACADVVDTAKLAKALPMPEQQVFDREQRLHGILARVTEHGLRLDVARVNALMDEHTKAREESKARLKDLGISKPSSNKEIGEALEERGATLPRTARGALSVAGDAVDIVAAGDDDAAELAREILVYRKHDKLISTFLYTLQFQCREGGSGRTHPTINQLGARATGRMSANNPNIQQFPRPSKAEKLDGTGGMRGMIIADPGMRLISADFSSVEVRLAAAATGDTTLARMVREGLDLHGAVVELVWGKTKDDPEFDDLRYAAKRSVFGYLYGAGLKTMSKQLGAYGDKAQEVVDALREITPGLYSWNKELRAWVKDGKMPYWTHTSGRVAYFNKDQPHKALNMVVQGWGREILVDSIFRWEALHPGWMMFPIHDELVIQVPAEHADAWTQDLINCMSWTIGEGEKQVPIVAESDEPTTRWGTVDKAEV